VLPREAVVSPKGRVDSRIAYKVVGGAVGLSLTSRVLGMVREAIIVGTLGVHDYTDAYFATSVIVLWAQNWSFGAWPLYYVPKYVSVARGDRKRRFRRTLASSAAYSSIAALVLIASYSTIERIMLGGRRVLGTGEACLLGVALAATGIAGVLYGRIIAIPIGIFLGARALLVANLAGVTTLLGLLAAPIARSYVLPGSLAATQIATALALAWANRQARDESDAASTAGVLSPSHALATTLENVAFNANAVAHQAIAGWLPPGSVTMNAYTTRLLLLPVTGLMAPVQQHMMQQFATTPPNIGLRTAVRTAGIAVGLAALVGFVALVAVVATLPFWPRPAAALGTEHNIACVAFLYGSYAGILFSNTMLARWYFASGNGWAYASIMFGAYVIGTGSKSALSSTLGLAALPLGAIAGEGIGLLVLLIRACALYGARKPFAGPAQK
jgi:peptidoglycan biosynthesis protein MviN/MurJ (putative lipid II flippase)